MAAITSISKDTAIISSVSKSNASSMTNEAKKRTLGSYTMAELATLTLAELAAYTFLSLYVRVTNQQKS